MGITYVGGLLGGENEVREVNVYHVESRANCDRLFSNIFAVPLAKGRIDAGILKKED